MTENIGKDRMMTEKERQKQSDREMWEGGALERSEPCL